MPFGTLLQLVHLLGTVEHNAAAVHAVAGLGRGAG